MAKTQTAATVSTFAFVTGAPVYFEHERAVIEMINWTGWRRPAVYASIVTGDDGWDTSNSKGHHAVYFSGSRVERYRFMINIDADFTQLRVSATATFGAGETGSTYFTIGGGSATLNHAAATTAEVTGTINTSASGTGWQLVTVEIERTAGSASTNELLDFAVQDEERTSSLPDPQNE